jgi:hypothetical protein
LEVVKTRKWIAALSLAGLVSGAFATVSQGRQATMMEKKRDASCRVNQLTCIRMNGKNAKLENVEAGMKVSVTVGSDGKTLAALESDDYIPAKTVIQK